MSLSRPVFKFPYCNYPFTFYSKIYYYFGKIVCAGISLSGANLYAKIMWKHPSLNEKRLIAKSVSELTDLKRTSKHKRKWHLRSIFFNVLISIPAIYYLRYFSSISESNIWRIAGLNGIILINNFYGFLAHTYNIIRYSTQIEVINHGINIARAIKAVEIDLKKIEPNNKKFFNQEIIDNMIYSQLENKKTNWHKIIYTDHATQEIAHVIVNEYYEKLFFIFNIDATANDFMIELRKLTVSQIDLLANNLLEAYVLQNEFIQNRLKNTLVYSYYNNNN
jgi:hypothetical protein